MRGNIMAFELPEKCLRGRNNCDPISQIAADDESSFFCVGQHDGSIAKVLQDKYTCCFKGDHDDDVSLYDKRDLIHHMAVFAEAIAIIQQREENEAVDND
jgi:hypothetical protein